MTSKRAADAIDSVRRGLTSGRRPWAGRAVVRPPADAAADRTGLPPRASTTAIDLEPRRRELAARVAELQWDLGGLTYEMAIRDHIRVDVLVARAAALQEADSALAEVERVLRMDAAGASGGRSYAATGVILIECPMIAATCSASTSTKPNGSASSGSTASSQPDSPPRPRPCLTRPG
jgi:chorismate mutase